MNLLEQISKVRSHQELVVVLNKYTKKQLQTHLRSAKDIAEVLVGLSEGSGNILIPRLGKTYVADLFFPNVLLKVLKPSVTSQEIGIVLWSMTREFKYEFVTKTVGLRSIFSKLDGTNFAYLFSGLQRELQAEIYAKIDHHTWRKILSNYHEVIIFLNNSRHNDIVIFAECIKLEILYDSKIYGYTCFNNILKNYETGPNLEISKKWTLVITLLRSKTRSPLHYKFLSHVTDPLFDVIRCAVFSRNTNFIAKLINEGFDINYRDYYDKKTALSLAMFIDSDDMCLWLLDHGANPNVGYVCGYTMLGWAIVHKKPHLVEALLSKGATPNPISKHKVQKDSIFILAFKSDDNKILKLVVNAGAELDAGFILSCLINDLSEIIEMLLDAGMAIDVAISGGQTLLILAAELQACKIFKLLLLRGANPNHKDNSGYSARDYAVHACENPILQILNKYSSENLTTEKKVRIQPVTSYQYYHYLPEEKVQSLYEGVSIGYYDLDLAVCPQRGDGNCFFHAVASFAPQIQQYILDHIQLRQLLVAQLQRNRAMYEQFFPTTVGDQEYNIDQYLQLIIQDGVWAGQQDLDVLSDALGRNIIYYNQLDKKFKTTGANLYTNPPIFLAFNGINHFDSLMYKNNSAENLQELRNILMSNGDIDDYEWRRTRPGV